MSLEPKTEHSQGRLRLPEWLSRPRMLRRLSIGLLVLLHVLGFVWHQYDAGQEALNAADTVAAAGDTMDVPEVSLTGPSIFEPGFGQTLIPGLSFESDPAPSAPERLEFDREAVLSDQENRIHDAFLISDGLRARVGFWFDVYTKWSEHQRVIHHARYPWIVYRVVDVTSIIESPTPKWRWMRNQHADSLVKKELSKIRAALRSVSKRRHLNDLNSDEQDVVNALHGLGGNVHTRARAALGETRVQMGQRNFFEEGLRISPRYLPQMERIFAAQKLPIELTRLPLVESSFNKFATSKDGAAGIWQFMNNVGGKFMLINEQIDERRSPFKATEAAARLLKENHLILHRQWPLALTAYNHGPNGVRQAVKAMGTKDLSQIVGKYRTRMFGFASSNFYSSFLAAMHAQMYNDKIWRGLQTEPSLDPQVVRLPRSYRITKLMALTGLDREQILLYNPDLSQILKYNGLVPRGFRLHVPSDAHSRAVQRLAQRVVKDVDHAALRESRDRLNL
ncbi:MAG: lytic transglycosylase domain-containing protein [Bdellovibrionaceae bacterium]|nr:lytic transglycosylase domain-containing protein [Pseudobdellovibrionaceae bacterium]